MKKILLALFLSVVFSSNAYALKFVRVDGGTPTGVGGTTVCNGTVDAPAAGNSPNCAYNHPNWAIPALNQPTTYRISPSETLVIGPGSYRMGCQGTADCRDATKNYTNTTCNASATYDCAAHTLPSGNATTSTKIIGCGVNGCTGQARPELWLAGGRLGSMFNITGTSYIELSDLEITDHSGHDYYSSAAASCVQSINSLCGDNAIDGSGGGWHHIKLNKVNIHGLHGFALYLSGGGPSSTPIEFDVIDSNLDGNAYGGWNGDRCGNNGTCGFEGNIRFIRSTIRWNGCAEAYPLNTHADPKVGNLPTPGTCREGNNGGYGDGIGTSDTSGHWLFEDVICSHNTSDCADLLYLGRNDRQAYGTDFSLTVRRMLAEGNNGAAIKGPDMYVEDSLIIGNCPFWASPSTWVFAGFSPCRAQGAAISIVSSAPGKIAKFFNNTIAINGDLVFTNDSSRHPTGNASTCEVEVRNNIITGGYDFVSGGNGTFVAMYEGWDGSGNNSCLGGYTRNESYNTCYGSFKPNDINSNTYTCDGTGDSTANPLFTGAVYMGTPTQGSSAGYFTGLDYYKNFTLQQTSPVIGATTTTVGDALDYNSFDRATLWDRGAVEYGSVASGGTIAENEPCTSGASCISGACCFGTCYPAGACPAGPTKFFIDYAAGLNTNNGTSKTTPWKTCTPIEGNNFLDPGDTVSIKADSVFSGTDAHCRIASAGTSVNPIVINKYGTGADPIFDGSVSTASAGVTGWTLYEAPNVWMTNETVSFAIDGVIVNNTYSVKRMSNGWSGQTSETMVKNFHAAAFQSTTLPARVYLKLEDGSDPNSLTIRFNRYGPYSSRGLVLTDDTIGKYIHFYNLVTMGSKWMGFSSSGTGVKFFNCRGFANGREGFYFLKNATSNGTGSSYNVCKDCIAEWNNIQGSQTGSPAVGQGITIEAPFVDLIDTTVRYNWMAGIDWLDYNAQTDASFGRCIRCISYDNSQRSKSTADFFGFDPMSLYVDGGHDVIIIDSLFYKSGSFVNGNAVGLVYLGSEHPDTKPVYNVYIINNRFYGNNYTQLKAQSLNCSGAACDVNSNIWLLNNSFNGQNSTSVYSVGNLLPADSGGLGFKSYNNIFMNNSGGIITYVPSSTLYQGNNNQFYSLSGNIATGVNLASWQAATGQDASSKFGNPLFISSTDLHYQQIAAGQASNSPALDSGINWIPMLGNAITYSSIGYTRTDGVIDTGTIDVGAHFSSVYNDALPAQGANGSACGISWQCSSLKCCSGTCADSCSPSAPTLLPFFIMI